MTIDVMVIIQLDKKPKTIITMLHGDFDMIKSGKINCTTKTTKLIPRMILDYLFHLLDMCIYNSTSSTV